MRLFIYCLFIVQIQSISNIEILYEWNILLNKYVTSCSINSFNIYLYLFFSFWNTSYPCHPPKKTKASLLKPIIAFNHFKLIGVNLIGILNHAKKGLILFKF